MADNKAKLEAMLDANELPPLYQTQPGPPPTPDYTDLEELAAQYGDHAGRLNAPSSKTETPATERQRRHMEWRILAQADAPPFEWLIPHWLSWHPTLLSGRGSIGKSLLAQQLGTALATGTPFIGAAAQPLRVLGWFCEDEHDELWRRQERICAAMGLPLGGMGNFTIDARYGLRNELFVVEYGRGLWTGVMAELAQQIEETQADVLILDNIGHIYGGDENNRHLVTMFTNGISGLVTHRKFSTILLGHPAKSQGSEYSGSTAWENSVRMRWYMADKLPDEQGENGDDYEPDTNTRYLSKRKSNYTALDYIKFGYDTQKQVLVPDNTVTEAQDTPTAMSLRRQRAESVLLSAIKALAERGEYGTNSPSRTFLPTVICQFKLNEECTRKELTDAMRNLIMAGKIKRDVVGKNAAGYKREGLVIVGSV